MQISVPLVFHCAGPHKNATPEVKICVSPARNRGSDFFFASRCSAVAIFVHSVVTPRESTSSGQKMRLRRSKFAFRLRRATKNASRQFKICVSPARNTRSDCFPCAGPHKTRLRSSKFAFRLRETLPRISAGLFSLRRATQNASPEVKICVSPAQGHKIG